VLTYGCTSRTAPLCRFPLPDGLPSTSEPVVLSGRQAAPLAACRTKVSCRTVFGKPQEFLELVIGLEHLEHDLGNNVTRERRDPLNCPDSFLGSSFLLQTRKFHRTKRPSDWGNNPHQNKRHSLAVPDRDRKGCPLRKFQRRFTHPFVQVPELLQPLMRCSGPTRPDHCRGDSRLLLRPKGTPQQKEPPS
jgi:hypothetical protein